jgi:hypothetical protein
VRTPRAALLAGLALLLWGAGAWAQSQVAIRDLLAEPDRWHGRPVAVAGTVTGLEPRVSGRGNPYFTFILRAEGAAMTVFSYGSPQVRDGDRVQVEGTFLKVKRVGLHTFQNQVEARRISRR